MNHHLDNNTRRYPRTLAEAFPNSPDYACAIEGPRRLSTARLASGVLWALLLALLLGAAWGATQ